MMDNVFRNYRKAGKDDIRCLECAKSFFPVVGKRLRCEDWSGSQAVGKNMTCDAARRKT